jgi:hypothetical protein
MTDTYKLQEFLARKLAYDESIYDKYTYSYKLNRIAVAKIADQYDKLQPMKTTAVLDDMNEEDPNATVDVVMPNRMDDVMSIIIAAYIRCPLPAYNILHPSDMSWCMSSVPSGIPLLFKQREESTPSQMYINVIDVLGYVNEIAETTYSERYENIFMMTIPTSSETELPTIEVVKIIRKYGEKFLKDVLHKSGASFGSQALTRFF